MAGRLKKLPGVLSAGKKYGAPHISSRSRSLSRSSTEPLVTLPRRRYRQKLRIPDWKGWQAKVKTTQIINNLSGFWIEMPKFSNLEFLRGSARGERAPAYGFLYGLPDKGIEPFVVEGLPVPYDGFNDKFQILFAGFAEVPVGIMKEGTIRFRLLYFPLADITGKTLHGTTPGHP
jgi:hypothetical protein